MGGVALMAELARERPDIQVLLTSGFRDDTMLRDDGIDATIPFLDKPYSATKLRQAVRGALDARRHDRRGGGGSEGTRKP